MKIPKAQCILLMSMGLVACGSKDWRAQAVADAEETMRSETGDAAAQFSKLQVTGDSSSGQTCGVVITRTGAGLEQFARFIVYIDGAGPYIDKGLGPHPISQEKFDFAWENDCLKEGYKA